MKHQPAQFDGAHVKHLESIILQLRREQLMLRSQMASIVTLAKTAIQERDDARAELHRIQNP